ncbi:glycoside hydrolase family 2 protein [Tabrizicola sp.]|uniref:glycoside hydrolase family 2 protein n=1 Tax=Tabrizicola sp. TaxID=2005166 RepID=UPI0035B2376A
MMRQTVLSAQPATPLRPCLSLDGTWQFRHESQSDWREVRVPGHWQAQFPELAVAFGRVTYLRELTIPDAWTGFEVALAFGAVSDTAVVRLDGAELARHEGGYLPFEVVLPSGLSGTHQLEVEAFLPDGHRSEGADLSEIPHGKQSWYGPQGGIWQSVRLEARHPAHIRAMRLDPHWPDGRLALEIALSRPVAGSLRLEIEDPKGQAVQAVTLDLGGARVRHELVVPDVRPWSPESPALYTLRATLSLDGQEIDLRLERFGFRRIETRDGQIWLNGAPLYLRGALDQDYYPDGFGAPPSIALLEDQVRNAKAMGLNCLRCHIKVPDPRYHEVADRLGLLMWTEIPNIETFTPDSARRLRETMEGILERDRNHPSIVIWTLINEDWGTRLREVAEQRQWLSDMVDWLRKEDPLRLVVDNSACFPNWHVNTDLNDYHYYRTATDRREEWDALNVEFAAGADWTFGSGPDITRTGQEPLIVSEFGVWGLPQPDLLRLDGQDPWWMAYGATWADGAVLPQGVEARFRELGLAQVFGSFPAFIDQVQWHQWMNLKHEIEVMRRHPTIAGYVITEFTDVHWEGNGLLDMARNPRIFAPAMPKANADIVISPGLARHAARAGTPVQFDLTVATGGASLPEGCLLDWSFGSDSGRATLAAAGPMQVIPVPVSTATHATAATALVRADFTLTTPDGSILARNDETVSLYAARHASGVTVASDDGALAERLAGLGYRVTSRHEADVFVTHDLDAQRVEDIHAGARILQLVAKEAGRLRDDLSPRDGPMSMQIEDELGGFRSAAYFTFPGYQLVDRHRSIWRGDWVGNFSWLRRDGVFSHLPGGPLFDLSFTGVVPRQLMTGFRPWEFQGRVHAGVVVGWVHKPGAFLIEKRLGRGTLVATTFRLTEEAPDADPVATALLDGLMSLSSR